MLLPNPAAGLRSTYRKVRARASFDFALQVQGDRIAPRPRRLQRHRASAVAGAGPVLKTARPGVKLWDDRHLRKE